LCYDFYMPEGEGQPQPSPSERALLAAEKIIQEAQMKENSDSMREGKKFEAESSEGKITPEMVNHVIESSGVEGIIKWMRLMGYNHQDIDDKIMFPAYAESNPTVASHLELESQWRFTHAGRAEAQLDQATPDNQQMLRERATQLRTEAERRQSMLSAWNSGGDISELKAMLTKERGKSLSRLTESIESAGHWTDSQIKNPKIAGTAIYGVVSDLRDYMQFNRLMREVTTRYPEQPQTPPQK